MNLGKSIDDKIRKIAPPKKNVSLGEVLLGVAAGTAAGVGVGTLVRKLVRTPSAQKALRSKGLSPLVAVAKATAPLVLGGAATYLTYNAVNNALGLAGTK